MQGLTNVSLEQNKGESLTQAQTFALLQRWHSKVEENDGLLTNGVGPIDYPNWRKN